MYVSQVTTETEFLERSAELQAALQSGSFSSYCQKKMTSAPSDAEQDIWRFLMVCVYFCLMCEMFVESVCHFAVCVCFEQVNFEDEARVKFLKLLGFSKDELQKKV